MESPTPGPTPDPGKGLPPYATRNKLPNISNHTHTMKQTSVHIKPCKIDVSETHNLRKKHLDYVKQELSYQNESLIATHDLRAHMERIKDCVKSKTGRSMQAKSQPIKEAVIVIQESTTMSELEKFAQRLKEAWGIQTLQIHIHRDEGHFTDGVWVPNLHAHLVFDWLDHQTGRTLKLTQQDFSTIQDMAAECLGMERGTPSTRKGLDAITYKVQAKQEELHSVQGLIEERQELSEIYKTSIETQKTILEELRQAISKTRKKDREDALTAIMRKAGLKFGLTNDEVSRNLYLSQQMIKELEAEKKEIRALLNQTKQLLNSSPEKKDEDIQTAKDLRQEIKDINAAIKALKKQVEQLSDFIQNEPQRTQEAQRKSYEEGQKDGRSEKRTEDIDDEVQRITAQKQERWRRERLELTNKITGLDCDLRNAYCERKRLYAGLFHVLEQAFDWIHDLVQSLLRYTVPHYGDVYLSNIEKDRVRMVQDAIGVAAYDVLMMSVETWASQRNQKASTYYLGQAVADVLNSGYSKSRSFHI